VPEGPEVKVVSDGIRNHILGRSIVNAQILSGRYTKSEPEGWDSIGKILNVKVSEVGCKGKFIYVSFDNGMHFFNTLGMTGSWSAAERKHSRIQFDLDDGGRIYFNDTRNFGTLKLIEKKSALAEKLKTLGPDMLAEDVSDSVFIRSIKKKNRTLAETLMDQTIISGVGNYLKAECLYFSKLSPHRMTHTLSDFELQTLNSVIKNVIRKSYETGGATIYTFSGFDGQKGDYSRRFAIYNQVKDPEGRTVKRETTEDGRTTFWVPEIQK
jgi:formamidopyrimidine-DNA glycosylase